MVRKGIIDSREHFDYYRHRRLWRSDTLFVEIYKANLLLYFATDRGSCRNVLKANRRVILRDVTNSLIRTGHYKRLLAYETSYQRVVDKVFSHILSSLTLSAL